MSFGNTAAGSRRAQRRGPEDGTVQRHQQQTQPSLGKFKLATWNCCGWSKISEDAVINLACDIVAVTETRIKAAAPSLQGNFLHTIVDSDDKCGGVWFSDKARSSMIFATIVDPRVLLARFRCNGFCLTVLSVYIPHQAHRSKRQADVYEVISKTVESISNHDLLLIAGDFNSRLARAARPGNDKFVGNWSIHPRD
jgi:exonuclease III